jgi:hypothetical protein
MAPRKKMSGKTAAKIQSLFSPGSKGSRDPDYIREYLTDEDAKVLIAQLFDRNGVPLAALSVPDAFIVRRVKAKLDAGTALTNPELVVLLHIQGVVAAFAAEEL